MKRLPLRLRSNNELLKKSPSERDSIPSLPRAQPLRLSIFRTLEVLTYFKNLLIAIAPFKPNWFLLCPSLEAKSKWIIDWLYFRFSKRTGKLFELNPLLDKSNQIIWFYLENAYAKISKPASPILFLDKSTFEAC